MAELIYNIAFFIALLSLLISTFRLIKGSSAVDRVISLDVMTIISISLIVYIAFITKRFVYIDVSLVYALISFIGVIAVARYFEGGFN